MAKENEWDLCELKARRKDKGPESKGRGETVVKAGGPYGEICV